MTSRPHRTRPTGGDEEEDEEFDLESGGTASPRADNSGRTALKSGRLLHFCKGSMYAAATAAFVAIAVLVVMAILLVKDIGPRASAIAVNAQSLSQSVNLRAQDYLPRTDLIMQRVTPQNLDQLASAFGSSLQDLLPVMASGFLYLQNVTGVTVNATELVVAVADIVDTIGKTAASTKKQGLQVSVRLPL